MTHNKVELVDSKVKKLESNDIVIALVGSSGTGKSTFVNVASTREIQNVGHSLKTETSQIRAIRISHPKTNLPIVLVDTPGFDDAKMTDTQVLSMLENWLGMTSKKKVQLSGIIYLHNVCANRNTGPSPVGNIGAYQRLCRGNAFEHVILVTTMWERVEGALGGQRESDLRNKYWYEMLQRGSATERFDKTFDSAWGILDGLALKCNEPKGTLQLVLGRGKQSSIPFPSGLGKLSTFRKMAGLALKALKS
ncbi:hypothetical protein BDZ94DRAFT_1318904 [Collybia nuda]|uniref:G domain-containing protein n=1 Tax=Collybia nuda TaxID=64659 RepID=A0A9P6CNX1_9AGAR|nr:hypothetical protein BDZ94DRAFT_1318904 [Collybia nuda]